MSPVPKQTLAHVRARGVSSENKITGKSTNDKDKMWRRDGNLTKAEKVRHKRNLIEHDLRVDVAQRVSVEHEPVSTTSRTEFDISIVVSISRAVPSTWCKSSTNGPTALTPSTGAFVIGLREIPCAREALLTYIVPLFHMDVQPLANFDSLE